MIEVLVEMLKDMGTALRKEDTKAALKAVKKDETLNDYFKKAVKKASTLIVENPEQAKELITLLFMVRNLERSGDLTKNIAEDIVLLTLEKDKKRKFFLADKLPLIGIVLAIAAVGVVILTTVLRTKKNL